MIEEEDLDDDYGNSGMEEQENSEANAADVNHVMPTIHHSCRRCK